MPSGHSPSLGTILEGEQAPFPHVGWGKHDVVCSLSCVPEPLPECCIFSSGPISCLDALAFVSALAYEAHTSPAPGTQLMSQVVLSLVCELVCSGK